MRGVRMVVRPPHARCADQTQPRCRCFGARVDGVLTHSDAMKFRMMIHAPVPTDRRLSPTTEDLRYAKRFLVETAVRTNQRVGIRLAQLLDEFHQANPSLFDAQTRANEVSRRFAVLVMSHGFAGVV